MFGEPQMTSLQRTALFLGSIVILAMGVYSTGMTVMNVITNSKYSLTQSVTARTAGPAAMFGIGYFDNESACEEMARPFPGMSEEEKTYQQASQERCVKRVEEQRRQVRTLDFAHSALLLLIGSSLYLISRKR
jgi:hypothetical protein